MYRQKRYKECIKEVKSKLKLARKSLHLLNYHAMACSALKRDREALLSYQKIKKLDPTLAGPYYNMGIILKRNGRVEEAIGSYKKAISLKSDYVQAYNNLGALYKDKEEYENAIEMFTKAISLKSDYVQAYNNLGALYKDKEEYENAIEMFTKVKEIQPDDQNSYYNLALIKKEQGLNEEAIKFFLQVLDLNPEHSDAKANAETICNELGSKLYKEGDNESALKYFKILTLLRPKSAACFYNTGNTYLELKDFKNAKTYFKSALNIEPNYEMAHSNLGALYRTLGKFKKSRKRYKEAIRINPQNANNYYNLAISLSEAGRVDNAEKSYKKAILVDPKHVGSYNNLALLHEAKGQTQEALNIAKKVLTFENNHSTTNYSIGLLSLLLGNFKEGWKYFEYRWKAPQFNKTTWPLQDKPMWKGERGKRVVLWKEQGIGDQIIFLSLVPEVKQMCSRLSVYVDPRLGSLCRRAMPEIHFIANEKELNRAKCDYHLPIQSLGSLIRNDISDFDRSVKGFFEVDPERVKVIRDELNLAGKMVIGISWRSFNTRYKTKSVQLKDMEHIFSGLDVVLVNLQYGDVEDEIREFKEATGIDVLQCASVDNREDLDGLAALIEVCDLVVSTSNVTVHIAGALAKETWVLLNYVSLYYWLKERTNSIWYPSLTLYRQSTLDDWESVYVSIRKDLHIKFAKT